MIITGGQLFIFKDDLLPQVTINGATVILDVPETADLQEFTEYINHRVAPGSSADGCNFTSLARWSRQEAKEDISRARSEGKEVKQDASRPKSFFGIKW